MPELTAQLETGVMVQILESIKWKTYVERSEFTSPYGKIPVLNGVYDLESGKLEPHKPENNFLYQVPIQYDARAIVLKSSSSPAKSYRRIGGRSPTR